MNPGLVVKLRPAGPWRIGPDSGARNRVDAIYHSDSLYSAVTLAMARLGSLEEWLEATARNGRPAVSFSSCFPFQEDIGFMIPPRTLWPPTSPALLSARVRWKSARFVPLGIVHSLVSGQKLDETRWSVDGPSECLVPAGSPGPFRTALRWSAAVDRLTGSTERHSMACLEFRPGAGLWSVVSFAGDPARERWLDPVKAAFRLLADTGFGGERSRGWGRSEPPEFIEGTLPDMILAESPAPAPPIEEPPPDVPAAPEPPVEEPPVVEPPSTEDTAEIAEPQPPAEELPPPADPPAPEAAAETAEPQPPEPSAEEPPPAGSSCSKVLVCLFFRPPARNLCPT